MNREDSPNSSLDSFCLVAFPNSFHLGNWYCFLMTSVSPSVTFSVTCNYTQHSWTPASRQSRLINTGTTKNIWVANKQLLLLIMGDVSTCASGFKILLLLRQSSEEPSLWHTHIILSPCESQDQQHINNSLPLTSGCLFVCFPVRIIQKPSHTYSKHWKENWARDIIQALAGQMQTHRISCCSLLSWAGALSSLHLWLFRLQGQGPPTVCMFLQSPEQDFHFCRFSLG